MPNPTVHTQFAMPDPNAAPLNLIQLFTLANLLVSSSIDGESFNTFIKQRGTPGVEDQDRIWFELDTGGRPVAIKSFYNGIWRRIYNGMIGEIRGYHGSPTLDFDEDGLGKIGLQYDGWHLCNGKDGVPDLSDRFLIGSHMNNVDQSGFEDGELVTWISNRTGEHTGGVRGITLNETNTFIPARGETTAKRMTASGSGPADDGDLLGVGSGAVQYPLQGEGQGSDGNPTPEEINIINPFIAVGWIIFVGYS
jgi:hypothetical protein